MWPAARVVGCVLVICCGCSDFASEMGVLWPGAETSRNGVGYHFSPRLLSTHYAGTYSHQSGKVTCSVLCRFFTKETFPAGDRLDALSCLDYFMGRAPVDQNGGSGEDSGGSVVRISYIVL